MYGVHTKSQIHWYYWVIYPSTRIHFVYVWFWLADAMDNSDNGNDDDGDNKVVICVAAFLLSFVPRRHSIGQQRRWRRYRMVPNIQDTFQRSHVLPVRIQFRKFSRWRLQLSPFHQIRIHRNVRFIEIHSIGGHHNRSIKLLLNQIGKLLWI